MDRDHQTPTHWPIFRSLAGFKPGALPGDLIAGLTLAAIAIPEQMATARLGGFSPQIGFFAFIAGSLGFAALGANRFLARAYEPFIYYLGPTPKIIFFPIMIMWFGVGAGSKVAMGALSCFFPIAISVAAGMREVDAVLIRVGRSFRATPLQLLTTIYLPAMRRPIVNGVRLGLGVAIIGTLLAETKLSNRGLGYLVIQTYTTFNMPRMYALLIAVFVLAIGANALMGRLAGPLRFER